VGELLLERAKRGRRKWWTHDVRELSQQSSQHVSQQSSYEQLGISQMVRDDYYVVSLERFVVISSVNLYFPPLSVLVFLLDSEAPRDERVAFSSSSHREELLNSSGHQPTSHRKFSSRPALSQVYDSYDCEDLSRRAEERERSRRGC